MLGSIGAAVYRARFAELLPNGSVGRDSLAAAVGARPGDAVLAAAREAFTSGMHVACLVGAAVLLATAISVVASRPTSARRRS